MKIVVTSTGDAPESPVDSRFGRAATFLVFDTETGRYESIGNNRNVNAPQGAGIQAAEAAARLGARCVITGHCGPKAFRVLDAAGIRVFTTDACTVAEAVERFRAGTLSEARSADVEGHRG
jgi:predicted Fe-Mo cluster-binding NifX family protein